MSSVGLPINPMIRKFLYLLFIFLLIFLKPFARSVRAQEETPTPSATYEPLFKTSTPKPTVNYDCPEEATPMGWGTVTPSFNWSMNCGQCVAGYVEATMTPPPSMTPYPTITGTLQITSTPTATIVLPTPTQVITEPTVYLGDPVIVDMSAYTIVSDSDLCQVTSSFNTGDISFTTEGQLVAMLVNRVGYEGIDRRNFCDVYEASFGTSDLWSAAAYGGVPDYKLTCGGYYSELGVGCEGLLDLVKEVTGNNDIGYVSTWVQQTWDPGIDVNFEFRFEWSGSYWEDIIPGEVFKVYPVYYGMPTEPTPTPTPTVTPGTGYCYSVLGEDGPVDSGVELPTPLVGEATCYGIPYVDVPDLFGLNLEFPGFELCFRPLQMGEIQILDVYIDMDWLISVTAGIWALRMVLRS